ncbi:MAG: CFI-box-CTERM domain-containing protein, partial [Candidatus Methylomirabilales bacterium]
VWQDFQAGSFDISGQLVNGDGSLTGAKITISSAAGDQRAPAVAYNSTTNQFLVVWQDFQAGFFDISGQLVNANGALSGTKIAISTAANDQTAPAVAYNSATNQFLVVWQDLRSGSFSDIFGQRVSADGTLAGSEITISAAANNQTAPAVAYNSTSNQFLVAWHDLRSGSFSDIFGQRVDAVGSLAGAEITISSAANNQTVPAVVYNGVTNQFLVVWQDLRSGSFSDIFGQLVNAAGVLVASDFAIPDTAPPSNRTAPAVAFNDTTTRFLVVWEEGALTNIRGRRLTAAADGTVTFDGVAFAIPGTAPASNRAAPAVSFNVNANQFVVVWQDAQGGLTTDIVGQVTGGGGTATPPSVTVISPDGGQTLTVGVSFTITWSSSDPDGIAPSQEIRLSKDGGLTFPTVIVTGLAGTIQSFPWTPTSADTTTTGRIRVTATDVSISAATGRDASNANFIVAVAGAGAGGTAQANCMIATAAFGSPLATEVQVLRAFRDRALLTHAPGRVLVAAYYRASPPLAELIRQHEPLRAATRGLLWPVVWWTQFALASPSLALALGGGALLAGGLLPYHLLRVRRARVPRGPRERGQ